MVVENISSGPRSALLDVFAPLQAKNKGKKV
jgi:hypothetical protein